MLGSSAHNRESVVIAGRGVIDQASLIKNDIVIHQMAVEGGIIERHILLSKQGRIALVLVGLLLIGLSFPMTHTKLPL